MAIVEEQAAPSEEPNPFQGFELPFKVATLQHLGQRAYFNPDSAPEWLFSRVHAGLSIKTDPGRLLRLNKNNIEGELEQMQVPRGELHYRATDAERDRHWTDHTCESRCLLVVLLWVIKNRAMQAQTKVKALRLLLDLLAEAFRVADCSQPIMGLLTRPDGTMISKELKFSNQGLCYQWGDFLRNCPGASALWHKLTTRCWLNRCISSAADSASFADIWFFIGYLYCHPKLKMQRQTLWLCLGSLFLPILLHQGGLWLVNLANAASNEALQMLPALKRKTGFVRRLADPVNKVLLLYKLRRDKQHRSRVARSHEELGGNTSRMMVYEAYVDCLLHMKALEQGFQGVHQVSVSWDPSTYGGKDICMAIVYDPAQNKAAYLMSQHMTQTMLSDLHPSLLPQAKARKLCRLVAFQEIRGLNCALSSIGLNLGSFKVPAGLVCRPLKRDEFRLVGDNGRAFIKNADTGELVPEVPDGCDLGALPVLVSISDQGPNVIGAVNFLQYSNDALLFVALFDPFHRVWNDLKTAMKRCKAGAWRAVLELALVANINYGPYNSSAWHWRKKALLENFLASKDMAAPTFRKYLHLMCKEKRIPEPTAAEDIQDLFESLGSLDSFATKGPLIKLMRWFSWFESMSFYNGELWATKILMEDSMDLAEEGSEKEVDEGPPKSHKDDQKELQELKKRKGCWKLAPRMITEKNVLLKDIIMSVAKSSWQLFAARAKELLSPMHVLEYNISCSHTGFWKNEIVEMVQTSLYDDRFLMHLIPEYTIHEKALEWHCDLLDKLLETRSESLAAFHCLPPSLYHHILAPSTDVAIKAHNLANKHWQILLAAEDAANEGVDVKCLKHIHWRRNPLIRCLFMAFEQDKATQGFFTARSCARRLQKVISQNLGDSRVIENVHQHGRDLFRASKANSISNTAIMSNALRSKVLDQRQVPMVTADEASKALGPQWNAVYKESVVQSLKTKGKKMPSELQKMMLPQKGISSWPSPAPGSLFQSAACTQWLFTFWGSQDPKLRGIGVNDAWLSFLAGPGSVVAQRSSGLLVKVLCSAEFGFLGLSMEVQELGGDRVYLCSQSRLDIRWHHIWDLEDWVEVQLSPFLVRTHTGPVGYKLSGGPPMPLEVAALIFGRSMTFQQASGLVTYFGGSLRANCSKRVAMEALIDLVVPDEQKDLAKSFLKVVESDDKAFDSDFPEVISELAQDDGNKQDLKDFRDKKHVQRKKMKMAARDAPVQGKEKKPKAKAKAKAKGKSKAKAKLPLGQKLLRRAAQKMADAKDMDIDVDMVEPPMPAPPAPPSPEPMAEEEPEPPRPPPASGSTERPSAEATVPSRPRHRTPEEIMTILEPPGCKFGISFHDHRFTSVWKDDHPDLVSPYCQKRFSRTFGAQRAWRDALVEVHDHNWRKWKRLEAQYPLAGKDEMRPSQIPDSLLEQLEPVIANLPPLVRYSRRG